MNQDQDHHHDHHHNLPDFKQLNKAFYIGIGLNAVYTIIEYVVGYTTNSLAIIADASHNLSDVASLIISLIGMRLAQKASSYLYSYGYKKASILASLINSILLIIIVINIFIEGIGRLNDPQVLSGEVIIITAFIGVIINTASAFLFFKGQKDDLNIRGAFLHLILDALVSLGVVIAGIILYFTHWAMIDIVISFLIGIVILITTWGILKESLRLTMDGVPKNVDQNKIKSILLENKNIKEVNHLHVWALSSFENALTVHIVINEDVSPKEYMHVKTDLKEMLEKENIHHATLELDDYYPDCNKIDC